MSNMIMQKQLLATLFSVGQPISTEQVANFAGVSWKTARNNLENLFKLGLVLRGRVGNNKRIYWKNA